MPRTLTPPQSAARPAPLHHHGEVFCCCPTTAPAGVISGGWDGHLVRWDGESGEPVARWKVADKAVSACTFTPDGSRLVTGTMDGMLAEWDAVTQQRLSVFLGG